MSFSPVIPFSGYSGWMFLKRTMAQQTEAFGNQPSVKNDEGYFRDNISSVTTAEQLVGDPKLLRVALMAFGLQDDLPNKFFIRKILEDGTLKTDALANKLSDKRYKDFSNAFGFGNFVTPRTQISDFADKILNLYKAKSFEQAVGEQDGDLRLALNAQTELVKLAASPTGDASKWYSVLGSPPLRQVFEKALGFPNSFAAIDLDKQVEMLQQRVKSTFGTDGINQFQQPETLEKLTRLFLIRSEFSQIDGAMSGSHIALTLLQNVAPGYGFDR